MFMDGVALTIPTADAIERLSFCRGGEDMVWRKESEADHRGLEARAPYVEHAPIT